MSTAVEYPRYSVPEYADPSQEGLAHPDGLSAVPGLVKTRLPAEFRDPPADRSLANFLGAFSIGLGLAETLAPRLMADLTGVRSPALLRAYGLREIAAGIGVLASHDPAGWLWGRLAGDVLDLGTLAAAYKDARSDADRTKVIASAVAVAGVAALDAIAAGQHTAHPTH